MNKMTETIGVPKNRNQVMKTRLKDLLVQKHIILSPIESETQNGCPLPDDEKEALKNKILKLTEEKKALQLKLLNPENLMPFAEKLFKQGVLEFKREAFFDAIGCFMASLTIIPDNTKAKINLSSCFAQFNQTDRAIKILQEVLDKDPDSKIARQNLDFLTTYHDK